ncbi:MAG: hypothetical protein FJZ09_05465 [Candidatus Omnitrophica bacterium]|nr:hypothetical protein [Candidatus Omnitrophota bacterium]
MRAKIFLIFLVLTFVPAPLFAQEDITITTYYPSPYGSYHDMTVTDNLYVGLTQNGYGGVGNGNYGAQLWFSGAPDLGAGANNENTDPIWIARFNVAGDNSQLRVNIGDNITNDAFVVGSTGPGGWGPMFFVRTDGRVGIGTTNPATELDVNGTARMNGFRMPTNAAGGRVLTSDASGNGTWQDPPDVLGSNDCYWLDISNEEGPGTWDGSCADGYYVRGEKIELDNDDWIPHHRWLQCCKF